ncbi:1,3-beta-glucan synthase [Pyrrhoderma noxium]|uniref:1,3-beta-glucan synthase n=1 Tax=Pyrrhoderma noxium TaxID=2282107 RepID=A0A286UF88_9AGAM|nr:1,3-beta-glucan synthase [Pyrrhoderma noxium]
MPGSRMATSETPTLADFGVPAPGVREPYPAWFAERDSMRNMFDFLMQQLDSRASRMPPDQALLTLHADYIGGWHANYRKWYFAVQLDLDDAVGAAQNPGLQRLRSTKRSKRGQSRSAQDKSLNTALDRWRQGMHNMTQYDRLRQIALYLLCWGEAVQVRFCPETLCFIFKCADDYYRSPECQNRDQPVPEDGRFIRRGKDHDRFIGYDDVNQLFWYPEGIARIVLTDKTRLVDVPPAHWVMKFDRIE